MISNTEEDDSKGGFLAKCDHVIPKGWDNVLLDGIIA